MITKKTVDVDGFVPNFMGRFLGGKGRPSSCLIVIGGRMWKYRSNSTNGSLVTIYHSIKRVEIAMIALAQMVRRRDENAGMNFAGWFNSRSRLNCLKIMFYIYF